MKRVVLRIAAYAVAAVVVVCLPRTTLAQCGGRWLGSPQQAAPDLNAALFSLLALPDGGLIAGGLFTTAGGVDVNRIARWDGHSWFALGSGLNNVAYAIARMPNGDIVVGGNFTTAGGVTANRVARWDGTTWSPVGSGMDNTVRALAVLPNGDLVAGGDFANADGVPASRVARWNGAAWVALGTGMTAALGGGSPSVLALHVMPDGALIAGGNFIAVGTASAYNVARWDGASWSGLGPGLNSQVSTLTVLPGGNLLAGGSFTQVTGGASVNRVARWDGSAWYPMSTGFNGMVSSVLALPNGTVAATGSFTLAGSATVNRVALWDGASWTSLGTGLNNAGAAQALRPNGELVVGGSFSSAGAVAAQFIGRWKNGAWGPLSEGLVNLGSDFGTVLALTPLRNGDLVVGGRFTAAGGMAANGIARWNGRAWSTFGPGLSGPALAVLAIAEMPNGDLIAGGDFTTAGGVTVNHIARWNGTSWLPLGSGMAGGAGPFGTGVYALIVMPNGDLIVGGNFRTAGGVNANNIARWDGSSWSPLGLGVTGTTYPEVRGPFALLPNGDLVVGGTFSTAGAISASNVARWDGATWWPLGSGMNATVRDLRVMPNGDLIAGGIFTVAGGVSANYVARWDGSTWSPLGSGISGGDVRALAVTAGGDLIAGGQGFTGAGGVSVRSIARWNGASWFALGSGIGGGAPNIYALAVHGSGEIIAGGSFTSTGGVVSGFWGRWTDTGVPWIASQPSPRAAPVGQTVTLSAASASGYDFDGPIDFHWERNGAAITDGPGGASPGGGTVSGASGTLAAYESDVTLTIVGAQPADGGAYVAVFSSACGTTASQPAIVEIIPPCDPDVNQDGNVDQGDVDYLVNVIAGGENPTGIDPDFTRDGNADQGDVDALVNAVAGGACP